MLQSSNQTLSDEEINLIGIQIQEQESRRNTYTNLLYDCVQEMEEHKKYKSYLKSGVCFYCGLGYVILRNHYANPKSACSAKYREDHPDTPHRPYVPQEDDEDTEPSQDSLKSVCANLENLQIQSSQSSLEPSQEFDIERNQISAHLANPLQEQEEDSDATQDICENLIDCSTQECSQEEPVEPVVCSHTFDCGCRKPVCEERLKQKSERKRKQ